MSTAPAVPFRPLLQADFLDKSVSSLLESGGPDNLCRACARTLPRGDASLSMVSPFTRVLVCTDGSRLGDDAVALGVGVAQMAGASIIFLHAAMPWKGGAWLARMFAAGGATVDPEAAALAESSLDGARGLAMNASVSFETRLAHVPHPERAILDALRDTGCDLIVMGARSGRRSRWVAARAWVPLLTCQSRPAPAISHVSV